MTLFEAVVLSDIIWRTEFLALKSHYALCNIRAAKVRAGQNVLVFGATGAIGSAAVQLLKYFGTTVTAVCATPQVELVKGLGADVVVDYTKQDFTKTDQRYDFVFDAVGKTNFKKCKSLLNKKGIYISTELGKYSENISKGNSEPEVLKIHGPDYVFEDFKLKNASFLT